MNASSLDHQVDFCLSSKFILIFSLGTIRSVRPLAPTDEEKLLTLLGKMQKFYQYHGINLRTCYEDFDRHHMGVVTESQVT